MHESIIERLKSKTQNWDDFRFFLAAVKHGSFSEAARAMNVSKPTVRRRISQLEERLGLVLFTQHPDGQTVTHAGSMLAKSVEKVQDEVEQLQLYAMNLQPMQTGAIHITTTDGLAQAWVAECVTAFRRENPDTVIYLLSDDDHLDLQKGEAHIAIRIGQPGSNDLVGRRLGDVTFGLFASPEYLEKQSAPSTLPQLLQHNLIGSLDSYGKIRSDPQCAEVLEQASIVLAANSMRTQAILASQGAGIACLPSYMEHTLVPVLSSEFELKMDLWLIAQKEITQVPTIRSLLDFLHSSYRSEFGNGTIRRPSANESVQKIA